MKSSNGGDIIENVSRRIITPISDAIVGETIKRSWRPRENGRMYSARASCLGEIITRSAYYQAR